MKNILVTITLISMLIFPTSGVEYEIQEKTFKMIEEASYSVRRSGEMTRKEAFEQQLNSKNFFNEQGKPVEAWRYEIDGTLYQKITFKLNSKGDITERKEYDSKGKLEGYSKTEYDDQGNVTKYESFDQKNKPSHNQLNTYDSEGNLIKNERTVFSINKTYKTTYKYNDTNQLIEQKSYNSDGTLRDTRTYIYDEKGNETESTLTRADGDFTKFVSTYDDHDNIITQYWYDKEGNQKHWNDFSYVYDEEGNWITRKRYSKGILGYIWERKIEYN